MAQAGLRSAAAVALGGALAACATTGAPAEKTAAAPLPAVRVFPGSLLLPPAPPSARGLPDTCGAAALAHLIGRPRTEIPVPVDLSRRRVACTACPVAPDVRLDRVNILYDAATGRVARITCG